jgi:hypothetical protein
VSLTDAQAAALAERLRNLRKKFAADNLATVTALEEIAAELDGDDDPPTPAMLTLAATARAGAIDVTWTWDGPAVRFWRVGRDGTDAGDSGPWQVTTEPTFRSWTFDKLRPATQYTVYVQALTEGGDLLDEDGLTVTTPAAPPPPPGPPPATGRTVPLVGRSGERFNTIAFLGGRELAAVEAFGKARGRPFDGMLWFTDRNATGWGQFRNGLTKSLADWLAAGRLIVTSLPHAPASEGAAMNLRGANDAYRADQRDYGAWLAANGFNHPCHVLRVNWEFNGNWYPWSAKNGGGDAFRAAVQNFVTNVRAGGATKVGFDVCGNKGPSQSGVDFGVIPGPEYVGVLGVDQYDHWRPARTDAEWATEIARRPGLATVRAEAARRDIMWSLDEGGNSHDPSSGGGDNPAFWTFLRKFIDEDPSRCAWLTTYEHDGAPATLKHSLQKFNPQSWATYKRLFGGGAA